VLTAVPGVEVGHWTDLSARTGCTVALLPEGTAASAEVRGGAPATRELTLLAPHRTVPRVDAVLLTGGSAFGLAAADGVMRFCEERGRGVPTPAGPVPIVPSLALFDLGVGDPTVRPGPAAGYAACLAASAGPVELGPVGAGAGATVGKLHGLAAARPGGLVGATLRAGAVVVSALVAVNAFGRIDGDGTGVAALAAEVAAGGAGLGPETPLADTSIGIVATNGALDKTGCLLVAQGAHDGLARALAPAHTRVDGDGFVAVATGAVATELDTVRLLAVAAVERAVRSLDG
jgi:L-aminopeptidase/D-esterase-like protein